MMWPAGSIGWKTGCNSVELVKKFIWRVSNNFLSLTLFLFKQEHGTTQFNQVDLFVYLIRPHVIFSTYKKKNIQLATVKKHLHFFVDRAGIVRERFHSKQGGRNTKSLIKFFLCVEKVVVPIISAQRGSSGLSLGKHAKHFL